VKSEDGYPGATRMDARCKSNITGKRLIEWRRKPGYRVGVNKRCAKSGYDEEYSKNLRIPVLTLGAFVLPLRDVPGVVNADSASESSDTSSEHHTARAKIVPNKKSQMMTTIPSRSID
jgi:hypothetical protein